MRKLLPVGSTLVRDVGRDSITGHVFVEDASASDQIQRWFLLGGEQGYRAPPTSRIQLEAASGAPWEGATLAAWLEAVRARWTAGSQYIVAYFRSHSSEQLTALPEDPFVFPGFWQGDQAQPLDTARAESAPLLRGQVLQFDVGTSEVLTESQQRSWMYRFDPVSANPSYEYCVLSRLHEPSALPIGASGASTQHGSLRDFVAALNAQGVWHELADTVVLGACYHGWAVEAVC